MRCLDTTGGGWRPDAQLSAASSRSTISQDWPPRVVTTPDEQGSVDMVADVRAAKGSVRGDCAVVRCPCLGRHFVARA